VAVTVLLPMVRLAFPSARRRGGGGRAHGGIREADRERETAGRGPAHKLRETRVNSKRTERNQSAVQMPDPRRLG